MSLMKANRSHAIDNKSEFGKTELVDEQYATFKRDLLLRIMTISALLTALFATLNVFGLHDMGEKQRYFNFFYFCLFCHCTTLPINFSYFDFELKIVKIRTSRLMDNNINLKLL